MTFAEAVLHVVLGLPRCWEDRADPHKAEQLLTISLAITVAALESRDPPTRAAELTAIGYQESKWCRRVHAGLSRGHGRGLWQVEPRAHKWAKTLTGTDFESTLASARAASRILDHSWQCGGTPSQKFTAYYGGVECGTPWPTLETRVANFWLAHSKLWRPWRDSQMGSES